MKYKIKISYQTGDSFSNSDKESYLDLKWDNLEIAKENLKAIREHYSYYEELHNYYSTKPQRDRSVIIKEMRKKSWCADPIEGFSEGANESTYELGMKLKADNGKYMQQSNFWCGYFETLYGAEIVAKDNNMEFEI